MDIACHLPPTSRLAYRDREPCLACYIYVQVKTAVTVGAYIIQSSPPASTFQSLHSALSSPLGLTIPSTSRAPR
jgi:hypothetical protein